jgi:TRAP transporter TAXI family solute receptor
VVAVGSAGLSLAQDIRFFRIGTGSTAGANFPIGGLIASVLSNPPGSRDCDRGGSCGVPGMIAVAQATQGSVDNAKEVGLGHLDASIVQADIAAMAYKGQGEFSGKNRLPGLRVLASLYPETLQIVVRRDSGITSLAKLKGKRVSLDTQASGTQAAARAVLGRAGIKLSEIKAENVDLGTASDMMREGKLDAFFYVGGSPSPAIAQLAETVDLHLLPVPEKIVTRVRKEDSYYFRATIPAGAYKGIEATETLSVYALLVVNEKLPDDLAYSILRSLWHKTARAMFNGHPQGKRIRLDSALNGLTIPLHPGAERYYAEAGLLEPEKAPENPTSADENAAGNGGKPLPIPDRKPESGER